jgi:hypothetical protein
VGALREDTLTRLLEMGGDGRQRRKFVSDAAAGMSVDAVVDLVKAAAEAEKQSISHSMVRLLSKLAKHADEGPERRRTEADRSLREAVMRLINDWSLNDPNPDAYREVLETISRQTAIENTSAIPVEVEAERLVQMGLEIGVVGLPVWRAVDRLYADQRIARLLDLLDGAPEPAVAEQIWQNLNERGALHDLLSAERPDMAVVERLVRRAGLGAAMPLLDAMESLEDSKLRERVGELLVSLGEATMPFIVRRLDGARAATVRDLLVVLGAFPRLPEGLDLTEYLTHADVMVRREAVKLALREPEWRDTAISTAVSDADQRVVYLALLAAQERCPRQAVDVVRGRVERGDFDAPLRALGVRVAATVRTPDTLAWLVARATTRTRWFKRLRMLPSAPEVIAAVNAIALGWKDDPAAAALLSLAKKSKEGELRQAATSPRASLTMRATDPRGMDAIAR